MYALRRNLERLQDPEEEHIRLELLLLANFQQQLITSE